MKNVKSSLPHGISVVDYGLNPLIEEDTCPAVGLVDDDNDYETFDPEHHVNHYWSQ